MKIGRTPASSLEADLPGSIARAASSQGKGSRPGDTHLGRTLCDYPEKVKRRTPRMIAARALFARWTGSPHRASRPIMFWTRPLARTARRCGCRGRLGLSGRPRSAGS